MIYLDHHAATPLSPAVLTAMRDAHERAWANPSSVHAQGRAARQLVERARRDIAHAVCAQAADLVFTAGGTEACNLGVLGLAPTELAGRTVVSSALEHPAIVEGVRALEQRGARIHWLPLDAGPPSPDALAHALSEDVALVALQWVNHETGAISPVHDYARACRERGVPLVVDASQALGKLPCDLAALGASAVVFASTKLGGPAGAAALWVARDHPLAAQTFGGAQERGRRAGTPDAAAIAGFAEAVRAVPARLAEMPRIALHRDQLEQVALALGASSNASAERVATVSNLSVPGWRGEVLVAALDLEGLCASAGAACSSGLGAPSPVLRALYPDEPWRAESALRLSLGPETSPRDVSAATAILTRVLGRQP